MESGKATDDLARSQIVVGNIICPTRVLYGAEDRMTPERLQLAVMRRHGASAFKFPNHGHMLMLEPGWHDVADDLWNWEQRKLPAHMAA